MKKKKKYIKEKIIYTSLTVILVFIVFVSASHAFPSSTTYKSPVVVNFKNTNMFNITGDYNQKERIDLIMTTDRKKSTCSYNIGFKFESGDKYIHSDDNIITVKGYDNKKLLFEKELSSVNRDDFENLYEYEVKGTKTVTENLSFEVSYNGENHYTGYVYIDNVICK